MGQVSRPALSRFRSKALSGDKLPAVPPASTVRPSEGCEEGGAAPSAVGIVSVGSINRSARSGLSAISSQPAIGRSNTLNSASSKTGIPPITGYSWGSTALRQRAARPPESSDTKRSGEVHRGHRSRLASSGGIVKPSRSASSADRRRWALGIAGGQEPRRRPRTAQPRAPNPPPSRTAGQLSSSLWEIGGGGTRLYPGEHARPASLPIWETA